MFESIILLLIWCFIGWCVGSALILLERIAKNTGVKKDEK
jgi:hypothetical protein